MAKEQFTYDDLLGALERKNFSPVYLLYGGEDFLADEATDAIIAAALTKDEREFNLDVAYGSDSDPRDIISYASSFPAMAQRRVVVVREIDKLPNKELLSSYIEHPAPTTCLVLLSEKADLRKKPYVTARRHGIVLEFKPLYDNQVPAWIGNRVRQQGWEVDPEACEVFAACTGTSLRGIQSELDKLYLYVGAKRTITVGDVQAVVGMSKEFNIFELQSALGAKDVRRSTEILERMLDAGDSATMMIVILTRFFATLWKLYDMRRRGVPSLEQARAAGINPFFLKQYQSALTHYPLSEIEHAFELLATADEGLKSTSTEPKQIMHFLIARLLLGESVPVH